MYRGKTLLAVCVGAFLSAGAASALSVQSQTKTFDGTAATVANLSFQQFDATLGELKSVDIFMTGAFQSYLTAFKTGAETATTSGTVDDIELQLSGLAGEVATFTAADDGFTRSGSFDEVLTSVRIGSAFEETLNATLAVSEANLLDYVGTGDFDVALVTGSGNTSGLSCTGTSIFCGNGWSLDGQGSVTVEYGFEPTVIPLPAAAWLLLGVSGGLIAAKRRQTRKAA